MCYLKGMKWQALIILTAFAAVAVFGLLAMHATGDAGGDCWAARLSSALCPAAGGLLDEAGHHLAVFYTLATALVILATLGATILILARRFSFNSSDRQPRHPFWFWPLALVAPLGASGRKLAWLALTEHSPTLAD